MSKIVREIECSNCGAPLDFEPGETVVTCKYCGFTCVIETGESFKLQHSMLVSRLDRDAAEKAVFSWMSKGFSKPGDLSKRSEIRRSEQFLLPFWMVPISAKTTYKGVFERLGPSVVKDGKIERKYDWLVLGRQRSEFPTREYRVPLEGKIPFRFDKIPKGAQVLNSEITEAESVERARQEVEDHHRFLAKQDVDKVIEMKTDLEVGEVVYVHAPVWFLAYRYKNSDYQVILDSVTGEVLRGDIPPFEFKLFN